MKYLAFGLLMIVFFVAFKSIKPGGCKFPTEWSENFDIKMERTLVKNKIHGCATYRFMPCLEHNNEYLFQCSQDGENWKSYLIWPQIEKITVY